MLQRTCLLPMTCIVVLLCVGCVAKDDYLQKQAEADALSREIAAKAAESDGLKDQISRVNAEREKLTAERDELNARLQAKTAEFSRASTESARTVAELTLTLEELKTRNLELEGDKQMLQESIALLRKAREDLTNRNAALEGGNHAVQGNVARLEGENELIRKNLTRLEGERRELQEKIAALKQTREEAVQTVSKTYEELLTEMKEEISQGQIAITELKGKLTMDVVDKILFDSGQAEVKQQGLVVLKRVVAILKTVTDKTIRVEGHTDNVRIGSTLAKRFPSNWELSAARAINVTRYLAREGIDPQLLSAAALGEYQPVADNETPEGRAKNRRIAIILLPKE